MAFDVAGLGVKNPFDNGTYKWTYSTSDNVSVVDYSGYFSGVATARFFRAGDLIAVTAGDGKFLGLVISVNLDAVYADISLLNIASVTAFSHF